MTPFKRPLFSPLQLQRSRHQLRQALDTTLSGRHVHSQILTVPLTGETASLSSLRACVGRLTLAQAYMGEKVPVKWLRLEEEVARRVRSGLVVATWEEVRRRGGHHGELDVFGRETFNGLVFNNPSQTYIFHFSWRYCRSG